MSQDPHNLRHHYARAAARRRKTKALRTLAGCLALFLAAGLAHKLFALAA